jgi:CRISPR-associated protein Csx17
MSEGGGRHKILLTGCTPTPLAGYLKALGILRLVAEQKEAEVRGFWRDETFGLATALTADELVAFLLHEYAPRRSSVHGTVAAAFSRMTRKKRLMRLRGRRRRASRSTAAP